MLGCWGNRGGAGDRRGTLAKFRLVPILLNLLSDDKSWGRFCENDDGGRITSLEAIASIILFI